ncbi:MAG: hypothetical protein K2W85_02325 [Phycisphaerales bacterium]|nr:hypothetical protein [Phycisphaerales bacterium]
MFTRKTSGLGEGGGSAGSAGRGSSTRTTGLLVAVALGLIGAGVALFVAVGHRKSAGSGPLPGDVVDIGKAPSTEGVRDIGTSADGRIQIEDKKQPGRLAAELAYGKLDPVSPGNYRVDQPRAWMYLRDGRVVHVRADSGQIKRGGSTTGALGGQADIESGRFYGNVLVRVFSSRENASGLNIPIDPERDEPAMLLATESIDFDAVLLRASTSDPFAVSARNLLMEGEGLLLGVNQVRSRIEVLQTTGKFVRYNPNIKVDRPKKNAEPKVASSAPATSGATTALDKSTTPAPQQSTSAQPPTALAAAPATPPEPKIDLYQTTIIGELSVTQAGRVLTSDTLDVFMRLIDNQLPENAFGIWPKNTEVAASQDEPKAATPPAAAEQPATLASAPPASAATVVAETASKRKNLFVSAGDEDIVMRWTGPLVLRPIEKAGPELGDGNHFAARFNADRAGGRDVVRVTDAQTRADITCAQIEYAASKRMLALLASSTAGDVAAMPGSRVLAMVPETGQITAPSVRIDLGTGLGQAIGAGSLLSLREQRDASKFVGPPTPAELSVDPAALLRQITWNDQMDFQFRAINGRLTGAMDWAQFNGSVLAKDKLSTIAGDYLKADFMRVGEQESALKLVRVVGNATAIAGPRTIEVSRQGPARDPMVAAREIVVQFEPSKIDPNESDPIRAVATGGVRAANREATMTTRTMEAIMTRDRAQGVVVTDVLCDGQTTFDRADGVSARADRVRASPLLRTVDLTGQPVVLARDGSTIVGTQMALDDAAGTLMTFGEGSMEHLQADKSGNPDEQTRVRATWTKSMLFNNTRGTVECAGDTVVAATSALREQTLKAERLNLWLTPAGEESVAAAQVLTTSSTNGQTSSGLAAGERRLLKAEAIGASVEREGAPNASVEMRRYARPIQTIASADDADRPVRIGERVLEQVVFLDGGRIIADDVAGTVEIPGAGRAIVRDQKNAGSTEASKTTAAPASPATGSRGTSRFTWTGSMKLDRPSGLLRMLKDTELVHLPLGSNQVTRIVATQMDATLNLRGEGLEARSAELQRAEAIGAVFAESGTQKLLCDRLVYEALAGTALATSNDGNRVTLYDDRKPTPMVAKALKWDLTRDRVEVTEPAPITSPR